MNQLQALSIIHATLNAPGSRWDNARAWRVVSGIFALLLITIIACLFSQYTGLGLLILTSVKLVGVGFLWVLLSQSRTEIMAFRAIIERQAQWCLDGGSNSDKPDEYVPQIEVSGLSAEAIAGAVFLLLPSSLLFMDGPLVVDSRLLLLLAEFALVVFSWRVDVLVFGRMRTLSSVSQLLHNFTVLDEKAQRERPLTL